MIQKYRYTVNFVHFPASLQASVSLIIHAACNNFLWLSKHFKMKLKFQVTGEYAYNLIQADIPDHFHNFGSVLKLNAP